MTAEQLTTHAISLQTRVQSRSGCDPSHDLVCVYEISMCTNGMLLRSDSACNQRPDSYTGVITARTLDEASLKSHVLHGELLSGVSPSECPVGLQLLDGACFARTVTE
jgi:hypothetical protein